MLSGLAPIVALLTWLPNALAGSTVPAGVACPPEMQFCVVEVATPGTQPSHVPVGTTAGAPQPCISPNGEQVPCFDSSFGWFNSSDGCYWNIVAPQPPGDAIVWEGHYPSGQIWNFVCLVIVPGSHAGWTWRASPPPGYGGSADPAQLAQEAISQMALAGPEIRLSIPADKFATVGVPVWLWTDVTPTTWGPTSATASVPGLSVTATAQARQIVWDTGDGLSETCKNPGTAYYTGGVVSPTCQHVYQRSSADQPGLAYPIRATTTWDVTWTGGGSSGSLTVTRVSTSQVRVGEMQVLVTTS